MRILVLGATGFIGSAVSKNLITAGHHVLALARSDEAELQLSRQGAAVVRGDLRRPEAWSAAVHEVDAVIHVAATFSADMGDVDRKVVEELVAQGSQADRQIKFVYTGGVWLYGPTGDAIADERTPFNPIASFAWMVDNAAIVFGAACFHTNVVHPGMCYERDGGVFARLVPKNGLIEVWGSLDTRWPVVHKDDLASAYRLIVEGAPAGEAYNVSAEHGVRVGDVASSFSQRHDAETELWVRSVDDVVAEHGNWAVGPTLDQQVTSRKIVQQLGWTPIHTDAVSEMGLAST
jgi:nucleoside-diphosphate-sugar epimerase